jgi:hypothetical protein
MPVMLFVNSFVSGTRSAGLLYQFAQVLLTCPSSTAALPDAFRAQFAKRTANERL